MKKLSRVISLSAVHSLRTGGFQYLWSSLHIEETQVGIKGVHKGI